MLDIIREAPFGQLVRLLTRGKALPYPEELSTFSLPASYGDGPESAQVKHSGAPSSSSSSRSSIKDEDMERQPSRDLPLTSSPTNATDLIAAQQQQALEKTTSSPIAPVKTADGLILADWYATDDAANPQNWSQWKKAFVALQIDLYTFVVYAGSSIYVSSELGVMAEFGVGAPKASLGLALYVLGYGIGPLLWAPMSEIPTFGRNVPYVASFAIYLILCVPTALSNNLAGLLVLRFLQGFLGSPCLANGGASMQDLYSFMYLPYSLSSWVSAAFAAPALGPLISGFAVTAENWRWSLWEILWMASPVFLLWFFFLPETSASNILLRRATRLRQLTGNERIRSQAEINRRGLTTNAIVFDALIKPLEIMIKDPAVLFTNLYTALTYGIYYSFFEVFALVYGPIYGFNLGETGALFVCIVVGCVLAMAIYFSYIHFSLIPDMKANGMRPQEWRLRPALLAVFGPPIGLFLFAWTANEHVHWIVSVIGITIYALSCYILLQCIFVYIPMTYPPYAASLFASNDLCRSAFATGAVLFSRPMFINLGIGQGVSLLAGLSVMGIIGMWLLYFYGADLRARSKFALS
ncbi:MAG: hypothetical protein M1838_004612 [Thelocarpon superellum]|nr:MAG: hypothetical protein M1838_004612 [Thelocarpon superellum]